MNSPITISQAIEGYLLDARPRFPLDLGHRRRHCRLTHRPYHRPSHVRTESPRPFPAPHPAWQAPVCQYPPSAPINVPTTPKITGVISNPCGIELALGLFDLDLLVQ
jgi:hypothetical protein